MNWTDFIRDINLQEYVASAGYKYMPKKSTPKWKVYSNEVTDDVITIFRHSDSGNLCYKNLREASDKGNIVNFVMNRLSGFVRPNTNKDDYIRVAEILKEYLNIYQVSSSVRLPLARNEEPVMEKPIEDKFDFSQFNSQKITSVQSVEYLINRGIDKNVYSAPIFSDRVVLVNPVWEMTEGRSRNVDSEPRVGFPLTYEDRVVGLEIRYPDRKLFAQHTNREQGMWYSNFRKNATVLGVGESPIDCMSHYALSNDSYKKNLCYLATMGQPSNCHYDIVLDYIKRYEIKKVLLINDNDEAGQFFNVRFICNVLKRLIQISITPPCLGRFEFEMSMSDYTQAKCRTFMKTIATYNDNVNADDTTVQEEAKCLFKNNDKEIKCLYSLENRVFSLSMPYLAEPIGLLCKFLISLNLTEFKLCVQQSEGKDWNEDLKNKK